MNPAIFKEVQIVEKAIAALEAIFPKIEIQWEPQTDRAHRFDGHLIVGKKRIAAEVKGEFRMPQLGKILIQKDENTDFMLIAENIAQPIREKLRLEGVAFLDTAGNAFLQFPDLSLLVEGKKQARQTEKNKDKAFQKTGLKLVFAYLKEPELIEQPFRRIEKRLGISLDSISKTNESLLRQGFMIRKDAKKLMLYDRARLFQKWSDAYETTVKPNLFVAKYRFLNQHDAENFLELKLGEDAVWGGEPAADVLINFLNPSVFTIYTTKTRADLMREFRFVPDPNGNISVFLPFLETHEMRAEKPDATHPLLTYADLVGSGDPRNFEVAQRIKQKYESLFA